MGDQLGRLGEALLIASPDLVIVLNASLEIVLHNDRARPLAERAGLLKGSGNSTATNRAWATILARSLRGEIVDFTTSLEGFSYDVHVHPVTAADVVELVVVHARDVTATKAAELARQRLLDAVPDLVAIIRRDGSVAHVKEARDLAAQLTIEELEGATLRASLAEAFRSGSPVVFEHEVVLDGEPRLREVHVRAIGDNEAVLLLRDVTAQRRLTSRLMVADRMASLGTLAAGVAHELNNPLAYVIANLDFVEGELRRGIDDHTPLDLSEMLGPIVESREGLARMVVIVKDLKTFSRPDEETLADVDVNQLLDRILNMAKSEIKYRGNVEKMYGNVERVRANEARLGQVFLNLLVNAAQALDESRFERNVIRLRTGTRDGRTVVEVADNGQGISPENRSRVFDPFFTTKPLGVGTGLGLAICLGFVKAMGGEIELESAVGEGTIFRVLLPSTAPATTFGPERGSFGRIPTRSPAKHSILAIDDDPSILSSLVKLLRGHDVACCSSAFDALHRFEAGDVFDLVLCDVMMPHMSGVELFEAVQKRWPGQERRIAFMTGGATTPQTQSFLERTSAVILEKPFGLEAIEDCLQRVR
jgi:signal transduction histidine kinase